MLEKGGNAIDACVAVAIALPVVEPAATTFGSDNFAIIWSGGKLHGMSSSGFSPWESDKGLSAHQIVLRQNPRRRLGQHTTLPGCAAG